MNRRQILPFWEQVPNVLTLPREVIDGKQIPMLEKPVSGIPQLQKNNEKQVSMLLIHKL